MPFTGGWGSFAPTLTLDAYGNVYFGGYSANAGPSWKTPISCSVTAGWLFSQPSNGPEQKTIVNFLSGNSWSVGGGYWVGGDITHSPNGPTALQLGFVTPSAGGGGSNSQLLGNIADIPGPTRLGENIGNLYGY